MTGPRLQRRNYGRGHGYQIDGAKVPGVTTILNTLPKPALVDWAAKMAANHAIDNWDELHQLPLSDRHERILKARWSKLREASVRGTEVHALSERIAQDEEVDPGDHRGEVEAYARFLDRWDVEILATEAPCASVAYKYAGTLDSIAVIHGLGQLPDFQHLADVPVMLDLKTGRGVYPDAALQLAAYAGCDIWQPKGPASEEPMPEIGGLFVAHILSDDVSLLPVYGDIAQLLTQFRYLMQTHRWLDETKEASPIGAPLHPEGIPA